MEPQHKSNRQYRHDEKLEAEIVRLWNDKTYHSYRDMGLILGLAHGTISGRVQQLRELGIIEPRTKVSTRYRFVAGFGSALRAQRLAAEALRKIQP